MKGVRESAWQPIDDVKLEALPKAYRTVSRYSKEEIVTAVL
jgi:hypothetical protein